MATDNPLDLLAPGFRFFKARGWEPHPFQVDTWNHYLNGYSGLLNAPTGSGKTYAMGLGVLMEALASEEKGTHLQALWITPIRALSTEIKDSLQGAANELGLPWTVALRTGDTSAKERQQQQRRLPQILVTTPESLHLMLASKSWQKHLGHLKIVVADEWHELLGTKRAVQLELGLSRLKAMQSALRIWGISATIGNLEQALDVLLGGSNAPRTVVRASIKRKTVVHSILPDKMEELPWAGHLGTKMVRKLLPIISQSKTTLLFTNTRAQSEIWYRTLLQAAPDLAGRIAMHHGSVSKEIRHWVEAELHQERLKLVVCTSSLDLGVDFRPVETIIQVGSPKGVGRFLQRAGRSHHRPGGVGRIYFVPTHALELIEAAALKEAVEADDVEDRTPMTDCYDVLVQYLTTLAVGGGFNPNHVYEEIRQTFSFSTISWEQFQFVLHFLEFGGQSLEAYEDYHKLNIDDNGNYVVHNRRVAMRHRLSIGTIVSDATIQVKYQNGGYVGNLEESFISRMKPGDVFSFAGRNLELVRVKGMTAHVRKSKSKSGMIHSWMGGRMPLSSKMSKMLREKLTEVADGRLTDRESKILRPLLDKQRQRSIIPSAHQFLMEKMETKDGFHIFFFPFEGRLVHEGLATIFAYRISRLLPITFSTAYNDYGLELLSDQPIPLEEAIGTDLFATEHLTEDILQSLNSTELAKRHFRDIAAIAGLTFKGFPGKPQRTKHLQASSSLIFDVLKEQEEGHLLVKQTYEEVIRLQLEESRMKQALARIQNQEMIIRSPKLYTPLSFPIMVDRLREKLTSEKLTDRIRRMQLQHYE